MTPGPSTKVLLVGMTGSGKSTVGALLSQRLGWPYLDNDALLERTAGGSARSILEGQGEQALRAAESQVLTLLLGMPGPLIGGAAAGVVLDEKDRQRIASSSAHVVWLRAAPAVLARRVGPASARAWLGDDPVAALRVLALERNPFYEEMADQVIDVDVIPVGAVAKAIITAVEAQP